MQSVNLTKAVLEKNVRNREELIFLFEHVQRCYLPPEAYLTNRYFSALLSGTKKALKIDEIASFWTPPITPYFSVKDVYAAMLKQFP